MDLASLTRVFPQVIGEHLEGASTPAPITPGDMHDIHPSWSFVSEGGILVVASLSPERGELRVTLGLALGVPFKPEVSHIVNQLNKKELVFGRMFLIGNDESSEGCILMQEIFLAEALSEEFVPSLQGLLRMVATLTGQAGRLAPELQREIGGRAFTEEDALFLLFNG